MCVGGNRQSRIDYLMGLVVEALNKRPYDVLKGNSFGLDIIKSWTNQLTDTFYKKTSVDYNLIDRSNVKGSQDERTSYIKLTPLKTAGNTQQGVMDIVSGLSKTEKNSIMDWIMSWITTTNQDTIERKLRRVGTYSDIKEISSLIKMTGRYESLQEFINDNISDSSILELIQNSLTKASEASGKKGAIQVDGDRIIINLNL